MTPSSCGVEQLDDIEQRRDGIDVDAFDDGGFAALAAGRIRLGIFFSRARMATGSMPGDGTHAAVEAKLADHEEARHIADLERAVGAQDAERDGKVEARSLPS